MTHDDLTNASQNELSGLSGHQLVRMRGPADMAAMLPYLLGFYPDDSIVAVGLHGPAARQGGAIRLDIPEDPDQWPLIAVELARLLISLSERRQRRPDAVLLYLCRDPEPGARPARRQLRPLADQLLRVFREFEVPVKESLCLSGGRWWSFLCTDPACCDPGGTAVFAGQDPLAVVAAATYAGLAPRGSRKAIGVALDPIGPPQSAAQREALELQMSSLIGDLSRPDGSERTHEAVARLIAEAIADSQAGAPMPDDTRAARLIVALQDRANRDRAAEYAEPDELAAAQRLWRFLSRRCVSPYEAFAKAPLTLLAWTSWLAGDTATSRVALGKALDLDPSYTLADLLYRSLNGGLEPEGLLSIVRAERARRGDPGSSPGSAETPGWAAGLGGGPFPRRPGDPAAPVEAAQESDAAPAPESFETPPGDPGPPPRPARGPASPRSRGRAGPRPGPADAGSAHGSAGGSTGSSHRATPADRGLIPPQRSRDGSRKQRPPRPPNSSPDTDQPPSARIDPPLPGRLAQQTRRGGQFRRKSTTSTIRSLT
ncbi:DUF4192 domain-containing protein [Kitasatospora sp. NBC_01302]|uniref:DUF4192 domain-containing protein n=1 Tax=Kitasatospora sp. NBC_01302 TaxID=2903575 RepID=UPI002E166202|nr:DUF4192 family protein [Kitasatospora sp. NBC_01302]